MYSLQGLAEYLQCQGKELKIEKTTKYMYVYVNMEVFQYTCTIFMQHKAISI